MSKQDLRTWLTYHRKHESIDAYLTIVTATMAASHFIETRTGWSTKKVIRISRRYRTIEIEIAGHTITIGEAPPEDRAVVLAKTSAGQNGH